MAQLFLSAAASPPNPSPPLLTVLPLKFHPPSPLSLPVFLKSGPSQIKKKNWRRQSYFLVSIKWSGQMRKDANASAVCLLSALGHWTQDYTPNLMLLVDLFIEQSDNNTNAPLRKCPISPAWIIDDRMWATDQTKSTLQRYISAARCPLRYFSRSTIACGSCTCTIFSSVRVGTTHILPNRAETLRMNTHMACCCQHYWNVNLVDSPAAALLNW